MAQSKTPLGTAVTTKIRKQRPKRIVLRSRSVFRGIQQQTRKATEEAIRNLPPEEKDEARKALKRTFRKVLEETARNCRVMRNDEIPTYGGDPEIEKRIQDLKEESKHLQTEIEEERSNALATIEKRLSKLASETSARIKRDVGNVPLESLEPKESPGDVLGKELAERLRKRKEKALEMLRRLVSQSTDLKQRVYHVEKVLQMIRDCETKSSLNDLVNGNVELKDDNATIDLTDITGTVMRKGRRSRLSSLLTPLQ